MIGGGIYEGADPWGVKVRCRICGRLLSTRGGTQRLAHIEAHLRRGEATLPPGEENPWRASPATPTPLEEETA